VIPYDFGAKFQLKGIPGNTVEDVINITPEGAFVATAIGYGLLEERGRPLVLPRAGLVLPALATFKPGSLTLDHFPPEGLVEGFRVDPRVAPLIFVEQPPGSGQLRFSDQELPTADMGRIFQRVKATKDVSFFFSIVDSASGRELQDIPSHSLASLGKSNGERPFRPLARPIFFMPRSTVRVQVIEASEGVRGDLHIVLFGYKVLGASACPEPMVRSLVESAAGVRPPTGPSPRVIPFDYVSSLRLAGKPGNLVEDEVPINIDGGFVATGLGYALLVEDQQVPLDIEKAKDPSITNPATPTGVFPQGQGTPVINLANLPLKVFPPTALLDGMRIRPGFIRYAFGNNAQLANAIPLDVVRDAKSGRAFLFEPLNRAEDAAFKYTIFDTGTGREMQNMSLNNVAGLGIANGDRPFKQFARPMHFQARSTVRVSVEEGFGRGTLYLVFQGYKLLGGGVR